MRLQHLAEGRRGVDRQRRAPAVEAQRGEQRKEPVDVVAVEVRDEDRTQLQGVDAAAHELLLHPLARIDQVVLFAEVHRLGRRVARSGGFGRGRAEYGDAEVQVVIFCIL